jgi:hypothetical protein
MNKAILDVINSQELKDELTRIQVEMYSMGRMDSVEAVIRCLDELQDELFTKDNVLRALRCAVTLSKNRESE